MTIPPSSGGAQPGLFDSRRHLYLVSAGRSGPRARDLDPGYSRVCHLELKGRMEGSQTAGPQLRPSAWATTLQLMGIDERLVLTHRFADAGDAGCKYAFDVELLRSPGTVAGIGEIELSQSLGVLLPRWTFSAMKKPPSSWPLQAVLMPEPLRLVTRGAGSEPAADEEHCLTPPFALPTWLFTAGLDEPLHEQAWSIELRVEPVRLSVEQRRKLLKLRHELRRGARRIHIGVGPQEPYLHDADLDDAVQAWLAQMIRRPGDAYTLQAGLRSANAFSAFAIKRIARDIFGPEMPVAVAADFANAGGRRLLLASQGLGGLFASDQLLQARGFAVCKPEPALLPLGPGIVMARTEAGQPIVMPDNHVTGHTLVVGSSGSGKSSLLQGMACQNMQRGHGFALICPHGDLFSGVLKRVPKDRQRDVVVIDLADTSGFSVALNPFSGTAADPAMRRFVSGLFVDLVDRLVEGADTTGPQTRTRLRNLTMLALSHPDGGAPADLRRLLIDDDYRKWLLSKAEANVAAAVRQYSKSTGDQSMDNWIPWLLARVEPFFSSPALLRLLNRPSTADLGDLMQRNAIVLINLSKATLGEAECQIAGSLLLMMFHIAALRANAAGHRAARPYTLIVDEAHTFISPVVAQMCRESRKFGLGLVLATQAIESLRHPVAGDLSTAVLASTATKVFLRLSGREAKYQLNEYISPEFTATDLVRLPNYHGVMSMAAAGIPPFMFKTEPPEPAGPAADETLVRDLSGRQFGTPVAEADSYLIRRHGLDPSELGHTDR